MKPHVALNKGAISAKIAASASDSPFADFFLALIEAIRLTGLSPARLLSDKKRLVLQEPAKSAVAALKGIECPFGLLTSPWGWDALLRSLRAIARRAGVPDADSIDFDCLSFE